MLLAVTAASPGPLPQLLGAVVILLSALAVARRVDVRVALMLGALAPAPWPGGSTPCCTR